MTSSWFFLSTLNYNARSTTHLNWECHVAQLVVDAAWASSVKPCKLREVFCLCHHFHCCKWVIFVCFVVPFYILALVFIPRILVLFFCRFLNPGSFYLWHLFLNCEFGIKVLLKIFLMACKADTSYSICTGNISNKLLYFLPHNMLQFKTHPIISNIFLYIQ